MPTPPSGGCVAAIAVARRLERGRRRRRESALELLQGPHGREVRAVLLSGWDADTARR